MTEYISREATVKAFCEQCSDYVNGKCTYEGACEVSIIATVPTADVQPVNRGRWIISNLYAQCSECSVAYDLDTFQRLIPMNDNVPRHCSYCGARMDLKGGDAE